MKTKTSKNAAAGRGPNTYQKRRATIREKARAAARAGEPRDNPYRREDDRLSCFCAFDDELHNVEPLRKIAAHLNDSKRESSQPVVDVKPIKITKQLRKEVNAAVRERVGAKPRAEVGLRGDEQLLPNALKWDADSDLGDMRRFSELREIDADVRHPGCAELDLYVTTGVGIDRELETNVCVLIRDGHVVGATTNSLKIAELKQRVGFPLGDWDEVATPLTPPQTPADATPVDWAGFAGGDDPTYAGTDAGIDDVPHEDYPGQHVSAPGDSPAPLPPPVAPTVRLRAGRELTEYGGYGVARELRTATLSPAVYWSRNHNSYVAVKNDAGSYRVLSINGIGEIRCSLDPHNVGWQCDNDGAAAIQYFFVVEGGAL